MMDRAPWILLPTHGSFICLQRITRLVTNLLPLSDKCRDFTPESHESVPDFGLPTLSLPFSKILVLFNRQQEGGNKEDL